jgi:hypothetical protein
MLLRDEERAVESEDRLEPIYDLLPDGPLELYRGELLLVEDDVRSPGEGSVRFDWHAGLRVDAAGGGAEAVWSSDSTKVRFPDARELDVWPIDSRSRHPEGTWELHGHAQPQLHGDPEQPITALYLHLANYPKSVFGSDGGPDHRTFAVAAGWELTIDAVEDYADREREVRLARTGAVTHVGRIRRADDGSFTWDQASQPLAALRFLLTFVSGSRVPPLFAVGLTADGHRAVEEWGSYRRDPFGGVLNWCSTFFQAQAIEALWGPVVRSWDDPEERQLLTVGLEFYLDAQRGRNLETRLVIAQAGLELLAWHFLTRVEPIQDPTRVDRQDASWRLRRLVERLDLDPAVPEPLEVVRATWAKLDGPGVVCYLRNQVTHPKNVNALLNLDSQTKHGVLRLATWYLELALLRHLGYDGSYINQTLPLPIWQGAGEPVPWAAGNAT